MSRCQLRVFHGPEAATGPVSNRFSSENTVTVSLGDVLPLLADAVRSDRTWLQDFDNDQITISADLHEVILAYQHFRRPSA